MSNVLGELFGDIATAIREKTGDTATMKPAEFPQKISGIENSNVLDNVEIIPDFSNGHMIESLPEGYSAKSATIIKPKKLIPDNIAEGVTIAGIVGTHKGNGGGGNSIVRTNGDEIWANEDKVISHKLGVVPDLIVLTASTEGATGKSAIAITAISEALKNKIGAQFACNVFQSDGSNMKNPTPLDGVNNMASYYTCIHQANNETFTLSKGSMVTFANNANLVWEAYGCLV
jgi:hypothetical protein